MAKALAARYLWGMAPLRPLSVLDLVPVRSGSTPSHAMQESVELARLTERLGYTRYWFAEHHGMASIASSAAVRAEYLT